MAEMLEMGWSNDFTVYITKKRKNYTEDPLITISFNSLLEVNNRISDQLFVSILRSGFCPEQIIAVESKK